MPVLEQTITRSACRGCSWSVGGLYHSSIACLDYSRILTEKNVTCRWRTQVHHAAGRINRSHALFRITASIKLSICTTVNLYRRSFSSSWRSCLTVRSIIVRKAACLRADRIGDFKTTFRIIQNFLGSWWFWKDLFFFHRSLVSILVSIHWLISDQEHNLQVRF